MTTLKTIILGPQDMGNLYKTFFPKGQGTEGIDPGESLIPDEPDLVYNKHLLVYTFKLDRLLDDLRKTNRTQFSQIFTQYQDPPKRGANQVFTLETYEPNPDQKVVTADDLAQLMQETGLKKIKLATLATLFPNAYLIRVSQQAWPLKELVSRKLTTAKGEFFLKDAYVDVSGEIIVSHFYENELRNFSPVITQYFTPPQVAKPIGECAVAETAFTSIDFKDNRVIDCDPDSWPIDIGTMTAFARLNLFTLTDKLTTRQKQLASALKKIASSINAEGERKIIITAEKEPFMSFSIDFREKPNELIQAVKNDPENWVHSFSRHGRFAEKILTLLHQQEPTLVPDPGDESSLSYFLGRPLDPKNPERDYATILFYLFDHKDAQREYGFPKNEMPEDGINVQNPPSLASYWNYLAKRPTVYLAARIHPEDLNSVYFWATHIDTASYEPMGSPYDNNKVYTKVQRKPQHQGESEPLYMRLARTEGKAKLVPQELHLGNHKNSLVFTKQTYENGNTTDGLGPKAAKRIFEDNGRPHVSVSYLSGGRRPTPDFNLTEAGPTMFGGGRTPAIVWFLSTPIGVDVDDGSLSLPFPFYEASPGEKDLSHAIAMTPSFQQGKGSLQYQEKVEIMDGILPFQGLMRNGGGGTDALNTAGYTDFRAHPIGSDEKDRKQVSVHDFTTIQRTYFFENELQGHVLAMGAQMLVGNGGVSEISLRVDPWAGLTYRLWRGLGYNAHLLMAIPELGFKPDQKSWDLRYPFVQAQVFYGDPATFFLQPLAFGNIGLEGGYDSNNKRWFGLADPENWQDPFYLRYGVGLQAAMNGLRLVAGPQWALGDAHAVENNPLWMVDLTFLNSNP